jgi:hypothetical protein
MPESREALPLAAIPWRNLREAKDAAAASICRELAGLFPRGLDATVTIEIKNGVMVPSQVKIRM